MANIIIILILFISAIGYTQTLQDEVLNLIKKSVHRTTNYSFTVYSTNKKNYVISINPDQPLIPASTNKLLTTGVALLNLGKNFKIKTELFTNDKNIKDGIINGDLYLKGYGDPTLTTEDIKLLARALVEKGITKITGFIKIDDSFFEETFYRNEWIEEENISVPLPPISAVTINYNSVQIKVSGASKLNKPAKIELIENYYPVKLINKTITTNRRTKIKGTSKEINGKEVITITGRIKKNSSVYIYVPISNPALLIGTILRNILVEHGIYVKEEILVEKVPKNRERLALKETPLVEFIKPINKNSNNFFSEHLFLITGGMYASGGGNPFDASQAVNSFLKSQDIFDENFNMVDGSGISRKNSLSSKLLTEFLYLVYLNPSVFEEFYNSLSIPQTEGTLINRFENLFPPSRLRGKTGTLNGVNSLAGYVIANSGDLLIFSINFNFSRDSHVKLKRLQDNLITLVANKM